MSGETMWCHVQQCCVMCVQTDVLWCHAGVSATLCGDFIVQEIQETRCRAWCSMRFLLMYYWCQWCDDVEMMLILWLNDRCDEMIRCLGVLMLSSRCTTCTTTHTTHWLATMFRNFNSTISNIIQCNTTITFYGESGIVNGDDRMSASATGSNVNGENSRNCSTSFRTLYSAILSNNNVWCHGILNRDAECCDVILLLMYDTTTTTNLQLPLLLLSF